MTTFPNTSTKKLSPPQRYGLALSGILSCQNDCRYDTLVPSEQSEENKADVAQVLERDWGIRTRQDLEACLASLMKGGGHNQGFMEMQRILEAMDMASRKRFIESNRHDQKRYAQWSIVDRSLFRLHGKGIAAWDCGRYVMLCRWGTMTGLIPDQQAWELILKMARATQPLYSDWYEYGIGYVTGRCFWLGTLSADQADILMQHVKQLLSGRNAPWAVDWQTDLSGNN